MTRPSEAWPENGGMKPDEDRYKEVQKVLASANFAYLEARALSARRISQPELPPDISCTTERTRFLSGFDNVILDLAFSDHVYWIARVRHRNDGLDAAATRTDLLSEIITMKLVRERTRIPVPQIYAFEASSDQPFGHPFLLIEYLAGQTLSDGLALATPPQYLDKVAQQMAKVFYELQSFAFDKIGRIWGGDDANGPIEVIPDPYSYTSGQPETSLEHYYNQRQGYNQDMVDLHPAEPDWQTACWVLKSALPHFVVEDRIRGPFPLCHYDLHYGNLLFDAEYNLVGVIDWSTAQASPFEDLSVSPEFMTFPAASDEVNASIKKFKTLFIYYLKELEESSDPQHSADEKPAGKRTTLSSYLASERSEINLRCFHPPRMGLFAARLVAKLMYGELISWEQLREVYGKMALA